MANKDMLIKAAKKFIKTCDIMEYGQSPTYKELTEALKAEEDATTTISRPVERDVRCEDNSALLNTKIDEANMLINRIYASGCLDKYEENLVREYFGLEVFEELDT